MSFVNVPSPAAEPAFSREEWALLALVNGTRTVSDLVALAGLQQSTAQLVMRFRPGRCERDGLPEARNAGAGSGFRQDLRPPVS